MNKSEALTHRAPRISVVLPAYNAEAYLREAVQSVLDQSYSDFELIVLNDGSTDGTAEILESFNDPRLHVVHQENLGLALTLNKGIALARGEFIARQDADDVALPERFERQVEYLDLHPSCALLGTGSMILEDRQLTARRHKHPTNNGELQMRLLFDSFFVHSSVMLRRSALSRVGMYPTDPERHPPEDFDLWIRMAREFEVANLAEPLVMYRELPNSISRSKAELLNCRAVAISAENLGDLLEEPSSNPCIRDLIALLRHSPEYMSERPDWGGMERILKRARDCLIIRWPNDKDDIRTTAQRLVGAIRLQRLNKSWLGQCASRGRSFLGRFI